MNPPSNITKTKVIYLITKSNWGGAQRYVYDLATGLDQTRYEPVVALGGDGELIDKLEIAGIKTITLQAAQRDVSLTKEWRLCWELIRLIRTERPAVFHVNSSKAGGLGCFVGRILGVNKVVFTAHGWAFNEDRPGWQRLIIKFAHWLTVMLSHQTIAVSAGMAQQLNWPLAQRKMSVINPGRTIPHFVERSVARSQLANYCPALVPFQTDRWILIIAELHPIKQHALLFEAIQSVVSEHPTVRLVCIGDGALRDTLQAWVLDHHLEQHVFFTGATPEAATLLPAADLFVLPSRSESYGYVVHEAGLAGVPVIASNVGGITDIVHDGVDGTLFNSGDQQQLTTAITQFLDNPTSSQTMSHTLQTKLADRTVKAMVTATSKVYRSR